MTSMELVGLNTKWYRYKNNLTQEQYANKTKFKMAYISVIETGNANLTCKNIDFIAKSFNIKPELLFNENASSLVGTFKNCSNIIVIANDTFKNCQYITTFESCFENCVSITGLSSLASATKFG